MIKSATIRTVAAAIGVAVLAHASPASAASTQVPKDVRIAARKYGCRNLRPATPAQARSAVGSRAGDLDAALRTAFGAKAAGSTSHGGPRFATCTAKRTTVVFTKFQNMRQARKIASTYDNAAPWGTSGWVIFQFDN